MLYEVILGGPFPITFPAVNINNNCPTALQVSKSCKCHVIGILSVDAGAAAPFSFIYDLLYLFKSSCFLHVQFKRRNLTLFVEKLLDIYTFFEINYMYLKQCPCY